MQGALVTNGYGFDFGDWNSYPTREVLSATETDFSSIFNNGEKQLVISRICADLGIMPKVSRNIKFLIAQSNCAPKIHFWKEKIQNLICCFSDAVYGMEVLVGGKQKQINFIDIGSFIKDVLHCDIGVYIGGHDD